MERNGKHAWAKGWRPLLLSLTLALSGTGLRAQDLPCSRRTVPASVTDPNGKIVAGLTAKEFSAQIHGRPVKILTASLDNSPRRIVLLLDASGSMISPETGTWKSVLAAAKDLVENLPPEHTIALLVFARQVDWKIEFTKERTPILQRLDDLQAGPSAFAKGLRRTALWDAALEALGSFGTPRIGDTIYAISDAGENQSRANADKVKAELLAAGVRLFALVTSNDNHDMLRSRTLEEELGTVSLRQLAETAGGGLLRPRTTGVSSGVVLLSPAQLRVALDNLYSRMLQFYRLEIELPEPVDKMRDWKLEVLDPLTGGKAHLELAYPRKFLPCDADTRVK